MAGEVIVPVLEPATTVIQLNGHGIKPSPDKLVVTPIYQLTSEKLLFATG